MGLAQSHPNVLTTNIEKLLNQGRARSFWPLGYGTACCVIESIHVGGPRFDQERFGLLPRFSPRQSDLLIVAGTVTKKFVPVLRTIYQQMPDPKWVISMGSCANSGGLFKDSYSVVQGVDKIIPVEMYIPGCPPRPEAVYDAILKLREKILKNKPMRYQTWEPPELKQNKKSTACPIK